MRLLEIIISRLCGRGLAPLEFICVMAHLEGIHGQYDGSIPSPTEIGLQNVQTQRRASILRSRSVGSQPLAVADVLAAGLFRGLPLLVADL